MEGALIAFFSGVFSKIEDSGKGLIADFSGILNGISLYLLAVFFNVQAVVVGGFLGVLLAGKIDKKSHYLCLAVFLLLFSLTPKVPDLLFAPFAISSYLDEKFSERKGLLGMRLFFPVTALVYGFFNVWAFIYVVCFEIGYRFTTFLYRKMGAGGQHAQ